MSVLAKEYSNLDRALDEVRTVIETWSGSIDGSAELNGETIQYTQLVLHEWIANLLQHADFDEHPPSLRIRLAYENRQIRCVVVDNSSGFDLTGRLPAEQEAMDTSPNEAWGCASSTPAPTPSPTPPRTAGVIALSSLFLLITIHG